MASFRFGTTSSPCRTASAGRAQPEEESDVTDDADPHRLVQCPYDKNHHIRACRFPYHILKCKKNHKKLDGELKTCPFNASHLVPGRELADHIKTCKNRVSVDTPDTGDSSERRQWQVPVSTWKMPDTTEDWEDEVDNDAAPFVWGVDSFSQQRKTKPTNTLNPGCRAPSTLPWGDQKPDQK